MMRSVFIILFLSLPLSFIKGQQNIHSQPDILEKVENCLYSTYAFHFKEAHAIQAELLKTLPEHPAPHFLKALIIYWENFPLLPQTPSVSEFEKEIEKTLDLAQLLIKSENTRMEGIFFDMHARAFRSMFWADNGKPSKVIPDLDNMYRNTLRGIEYKEVFNEFYFSSGLYNYYVESYVEAHPVYKPIALLFKRGNKELGLSELKLAIDSATYIKYEALLFMSLIQLNFESNLKSASDYASLLYNNFPDNIYYFGQYLIILLHEKKYSVASLLISKLKSNNGEFHQLIYNMGEGFIQENYLSKPSEAKIFYTKSLEYAEKYGEIANVYAAIAHAGLSRIAHLEKDERAAKKHHRLSAQASDYKFILDF